MKIQLSILISLFILLTGCGKQKANDDLQALFGGGCFWNLDYYLTKIKGVKECQCVYSNSGSEAVLVTYDPKVISFDELCEVFFSIHDPKVNYKQQYRSLIQVNDPERFNTAQKMISALGVPTKVEKLGTLKTPESFNEDWYANKNSIPRCSNNMEKIKIFFK